MWKKFWKAETRAFQPYHQILCMSKMSEMSEKSYLFQLYVMLFVSETSKI